MIQKQAELTVGAEVQHGGRHLPGLGEALSCSTAPQGTKKGFGVRVTSDKFMRHSGKGLTGSCSYFLERRSDVSEQRARG